MVPRNSAARWGATPMQPRNSRRRYCLTSVPKTFTHPSVASYRRGIRFTSVDLPLPVPPITPMVLPRGAAKETSASEDAPAPG